MKTRDFLKNEWLFLVMMIIPFIIIAIFWNQFPAQIPTHWNFSNEIDQYSPKEFGLFIAPGLNVILYFLFLLLPRIDPRRENYSLFQGTYRALRVGIMAFIFLLFFIMTYASLGNKLNIGMIVIYLTLLLFLVIGNFLGKLRPNWFIGIRTPWTMENPEVWTRTHRLAGKIWVTGSLIMLFMGFFIPFSIIPYVYFSYIGIITLIPVIYSFIIYKQIKKNNENILVNNQ